MEDITSLFVVIGLFALRIGVPLALMAGLVYGLKRLDRRWEAEARRQRTAVETVEPRREAVAGGVEAAERVSARTGSKKAVIGFDMPGMQVPFGNASPALHTLPGLVPVAAGKRCWEARKCGKSQSCPAFQHPEMACWQARLQAEGHMPETCTTCEVFQRYPLS